MNLRGYTLTLTWTWRRNSHCLDDPNTLRKEFQVLQVVVSPGTVRTKCKFCLGKFTFISGFK